MSTGFRLNLNGLNPGVDVGGHQHHHQLQHQQYAESPGASTQTLMMNQQQSHPQHLQLPPYSQQQQQYAASNNVPPFAPRSGGRVPQISMSLVGSNNNNNNNGSSNSPIMTQQQQSSDRVGSFHIPLSSDRGNINNNNNANYSQPPLSNRGAAAGAAGNLFHTNSGSGGVDASELLGVPSHEIHDIDVLRKHLDRAQKLFIALEKRYEHTIREQDRYYMSLLDEMKPQSEGGSESARGPGYWGGGGVAGGSGGGGGGSRSDMRDAFTQTYAGVTGTQPTATSHMVHPSHIMATQPLQYHHPATGSTTFSAGGARYTQPAGRTLVPASTGGGSNRNVTVVRPSSARAGYTMTSSSSSSVAPSSSGGATNTLRLFTGAPTGAATASSATARGSAVPMGGSSGVGGTTMIGSSSSAQGQQQQHRAPLSSRGQRPEPLLPSTAAAAMRSPRLTVGSGGSGGGAPGGAATGSGATFKPFRPAVPTLGLSAVLHHQSGGQ